ncbi:hypothetical protein BD626DRAFT_509611 [Schizophyllum amplum]|uniref:Uncharacterized protein n=1 Tax=Schizophyllum amplum TaxID=97359 RepID=A0A550C2X0_9AGAR|nr:hypothetical protein BD626DRAFT_509611 [Auriculariopsis ampla]
MFNGYGNSSYMEPQTVTYAADGSALPHAPQQSVPRRRLTHINNAITAAYAACSLWHRLDLNVSIEQENERKRRALHDHLRDPTRNPRPDDQASLLTIREDEWTLLRVPSFVAGLGVALPHFVQDALAKPPVAAEQTRGVRAPNKRPRAAGVRAEGRASDGWRYADSSRIQARVPGLRPAITFHTLWYDSANYTYIPQTFFLTTNIHFINKNIGNSTIPTCRSPCGGRIFVVDKMRSNFPHLFKAADTELTLPEWDQSAENHCQFEISRDREGERGQHASLYIDHYGFFSSRPDRIELYQDWLPIEAALKEDLHTSPTIFDPVFYDHQYLRATISHQMRSRVQARGLSLEEYDSSYTAGPSYDQSVDSPSFDDFGEDYVSE